MTDTDWMWFGTPVEELSREEFIEALGVLGEMYYRMCNLYDDQCEATGRMMDTALKQRKVGRGDSCQECCADSLAELMTTTLPDGSFVVATVQYCTGCNWMTIADFTRYPHNHKGLQSIEHGR